MNDANIIVVCHVVTNSYFALAVQYEIQAELKFIYHFELCKFDFEMV